MPNPLNQLQYIPPPHSGLLEQYDAREAADGVGFVYNVFWPRLGYLPRYAANHSILDFKRKMETQPCRTTMN